MKKLHSNKVNSFRKIIGVLEGNPDIIKEVPVFIEAAKDFAQLVDEADQAGVFAQRGSAPTTEAKEEARKALAQEAARMAAVLYVLAYDTGDVNLQQKANMSYSKFFFVRRQETKIKALNTLDLLKQHANALEPYAVHTGDIDRFSRMIQEYEALSISAAEAQTAVVASNKEVVRYIDMIDDLLDMKIDKLVIILKPKYPDFYNQYHAARQIIDL